MAAVETNGTARYAWHMYYKQLELTKVANKEVERLQKRIGESSPADNQSSTVVYKAKIKKLELAIKALVEEGDNGMYQEIGQNPNGLNSFGEPICPLDFSSPFAGQCPGTDFKTCQKRVMVRFGTIKTCQKRVANCKRAKT
ncbi:hypothetical protein BASA81_002058 [Batrachochytrium salamandrivorans]|nr:hypothetical protein BASA81_002058 [Batrachochytrium salamandrivorans]